MASLLLLVLLSLPTSPAIATCLAVVWLARDVGTTILILLVAFACIWLPIDTEFWWPAPVWAGLLSSALPAAPPFGCGVWWGKVDDHGGSLLGHVAVRTTGSSLALADNSTLLLYGGWSDAHGPSNSLWIADWGTVRATQRIDWKSVAVQPKRLEPPETYGQSLTPLSDGRFLVFGGHTLGGYKAPTNQWRVLHLGPSSGGANGCTAALDAEWESAGEAPLGLSWHSATYVPPMSALRLPDEFVLVFGGSSASGVSGSVLIFEPGSAHGGTSSGVWQLDPDYIGGRAPWPRTAHSATLASDGQLWVIGGTDGDPMPWSGVDLTDGLWQLDLASLRWQPPLPTPKLHAPRQHTAVFAHGELLVFGGGTGGSSDLQLLIGPTASSFGLRRPAPAPLHAAMNVSVTGRAGSHEMVVKLASFTPPPLRGHAALWMGEEMIVVGGSTSESALQEYNGMLVMRPV